MNDDFSIPYLPETAPFTPEQRAYLNGFLAGLFSRAPAAAAGGRPAPAAPEPLASLAILFGSQTGNAESLAKRIAREAGQRGFAPTVHDLAQYPPARLASEPRILIVTSTYGDGEPPDNARDFWQSLGSAHAPALANTRFSLCALGDSNYPKFCGFGRDLDARLESLGARRVASRADCDVEFEEPFTRWLDAALAAMGEASAGASRNSGQRTSNTELRTDAIVAARSSSIVLDPNSGVRKLPLRIEDGTAGAGGCVPSRHSRSNPFPAALLANRRLNAPGSNKDTRHFELDLSGSGLAYEAGDALGVLPTNCGDLVDELLATLRFAGSEAVPGRGVTVPIREALLRDYEITRIPQALLRVMADRTGDDVLRKLIAPDANGELVDYLRGREIIDLLLAHPQVRFTPVEFVGLLKELSPRLYSIASSPRTIPGKVHLTVSVVRYESRSRRRHGVCSTYLAERADGPVPVFVQPNRNFRPPSDGDTSMIMVGPGTGVAPFRAFLQERSATGARGRNWLFYGDQRSHTDFMYREELEAMQRAGTLTRLDTAFSRDQAGKVYVQCRMRESAKELFAWLETGAHFYVCGDAARMAKDVDAALHDVVREGGGMEASKAAEYVARLRSQTRYQRDVY